ncbi:ATPase/histidine kinase/DNA gyrase B/HSP90 domain protein [Clostridiales bacterium oral taxon 876 str. F0540]|nr:ATPase/histidine kinase/DNA gyrase B/HSP90 domain protein [Clostridiales bacterium oral taxon 876 str. F0540]
MISVQGKLYKRGFFSSNEPDKIKIIYLYRYLSLIITSIFYLIGNTNHPIQKKVIIIVCITISSVIINYLYIKNFGDKSKIILLILIETIGNSFILIPSGGINSPYIWYCLNTILITSIELDKKICWINLIIYVFCSTFLSFSLFGDKNESFLFLIDKELNLILSLCLITILIQLLSKYMEKIEGRSIRLSEDNKQLKESMTYTMELYEAVHLLTNESNKQKLIELITDYTKKITRTNTALFYYVRNSKSKIIFKNEEMNSKIKENIKNYILKSYDELSKEDIIKQVTVDNKKFVLSPIKLGCIPCGILGIEAPKGEMQNYNEAIDQLLLLSELSSIAFRRLDLEKETERLVISEEQNRIANEIHDSVLQRLFSISCGIYSISKRVTTLNEESIKEELNTIRNSINSTMNELRAAVYGLSFKKGGTNNFIVDINNFIDEIKKLNGSNVTFQLIGDTEQLNLLQKKYLYRIICEGIGNAVRHGRAKNIQVVLGIKDNIILEINDDGTGFNYESIGKGQEKGLGIDNINNLVCSLNGKVHINTSIGKGTKIKISMPLKIFSSIEEDVI